MRTPAISAPRQPVPAGLRDLAGMLPQLGPDDAEGFGLWLIRDRWAVMQEAVASAGLFVDAYARRLVEFMTKNNTEPEGDRKGE